MSDASPSNLRKKRKLSWINIVSYHSNRQQVQLSTPLYMLLPPSLVINHVRTLSAYHTYSLIMKLCQIKQAFCAFFGLHKEWKLSTQTQFHTMLSSKSLVYHSLWYRLTPVLACSWTCTYAVFTATTLNHCQFTYISQTSATLVDSAGKTPQFWYVGTEFGRLRDVWGQQHHNPLAVYPLRGFVSLYKTHNASKMLQYLRRLTQSWRLLLSSECSWFI